MPKNNKPLSIQQRLNPNNYRSVDQRTDMPDGRVQGSNQKKNERGDPRVSFGNSRTILQIHEYGRRYRC